MASIVKGRLVFSNKFCLLYFTFLACVQNKLYKKVEYKKVIDGVVNIGDTRLRRGRFFGPGGIEYSV